MVHHPPLLFNHLAAIQSLLTTRPLGLFLDIDGTLAEIVPRPQDAQAGPAVRATLRGLLPSVDLLAFVTGRAIGDAQRIVGVEGATYVGNHGMELLVGGHPQVVPEVAPYVQPVQRLARALEEELGAQGYYIENKGPSLSVHFRGLPGAPASHEAAIRAAVARAGASWARLEPGKKVVNILPSVVVTKGTALRHLAEGQGLATACFVGDDVTDLHAFKAVAELRDERRCHGINIGVVGSGTPGALLHLVDYVVEGVAGVERFLAWLGDVLAPPRSP